MTMKSKLSEVPARIGDVPTVSTISNFNPGGVYDQLEELLQQSDTAQNAPYRMLAIAKAMAVIYKWNVEKGGHPQSWDKEENAEYRFNVMQRMLESASRNLAEFARTIGAETDVKTLSQPWLELGLFAELGEESETSEEAQLTPAKVLEMANASQSIKGRKGSKLRAGGTVAGNHRAIEFLHLLYRAYGLTRDQLRFLADFSKPLGAAAMHETSETIRLLEAAQFVSTRECDTWKNSQAEIYALTAAGQHFYSLLHQREFGRFEPRSPYQLDLGLQQLYGLNQIIGSLAGSCRVATTSGKLEELLEHKVGKGWHNLSDQPVQMRLDWRPHGYVIQYGEDMRSIYPGQVGRIVVDEKQLVPPLLAEANLNSDRLLFITNKADGTAVLPFIVEYDETGKPEVFENFSAKITAYVDLYNQPRYWPDYWQGRFPVILIVTAGTPRHMLELMNLTREHMRRLFKPKYPAEWWFTTVEWFLAGYGDYIGTFNNRRKPRPTCPRPEYSVLYPATRGQIWLPISALGPNPEETYKAVNGLHALITSETLEEREQTGKNLYQSGLFPWTSRLVSLPVPF